MVGAGRFACASQLGLSRSVTRLVTEEEFEEKWIALRSEQQEKYLFNAFKSQAAGLLDALSIHGPVRLNCLLRMDILMKDDERVFIDLLKIFLLENNDVPLTQPLATSNKRLDDIIGWDEAHHNNNKPTWLGLRQVPRTNRIVVYYL